MVWASLGPPPENRDGDEPEGSDLKKFRAEEVVVKEELDSPMEGSTEGLQVDTEYARVTSTKRSSDTSLERIGDATGGHESGEIEKAIGHVPCRRGRFGLQGD
eukprot:s2689_g7.t1